MQLGQLRFYPRALTAANIQEIYTFGSLLADISKVNLFVVHKSLYSLSRSCALSRTQFYPPHPCLSPPPSPPARPPVCV